MILQKQEDGFLPKKVKSSPLGSNYYNRFLEVKANDLLCFNWNLLHAKQAMELQEKEAQKDKAYRKTL